MELRGARILITGAGRRIGRMTAVELGRRGAWVAVHYRSNRSEAEEALDQVRAAGGSGEVFEADLSDDASIPGLVAQVCERCGGLDGLINNASVFEPDDIGTATGVTWDRHMQVNAKAPFLLAQQAATVMRGPSGKIVNIADVAGETVWPGYLTYSVSKAALLAVTRGLARALAPSIQVNAVCPGPVLFPVHYSEERKAAAVQRTLLKRAGSPADVVRAVMFFLDNDYITGEVVHCDGGRHMV